MRLSRNRLKPFSGTITLTTRLKPGVNENAASVRKLEMSPAQNAAARPPPWTSDSASSSMGRGRPRPRVLSATCRFSGTSRPRPCLLTFLNAALDLGSWCFRRTWKLARSHHELTSTDCRDFEGLLPLGAVQLLP